MKVKCQDCEWTGPIADCKPAKNLTQRVAVGESMPAGECPKCGALCHPVEPEVEKFGIYIVLYQHKHGHDTMLVLGRTEGEVLANLRADLVEEYGEEDIEYDEKEYGGLEVEKVIRDGEPFTFENVQYLVRFEAVKAR